MFISFFESFKYLGHLWPIALLRIYIGYFFLLAGISKVEKNYLHSPALTDQIQSWIAAGPHDEKYVHFLQTWVLTHWQVFSYLVVTGEIMVGVAFILGFMVRPAALVAIFLNWNFLLAGIPANRKFQFRKIATSAAAFIAINLMFFFISAGRCIGFDYYFFKKVRGFWW